MKHLIWLLTLATASASFAQNCIPAHEYIPFAGKAALKNREGNFTLGTYQRISPDGRYILRSLSGDQLSRVTLIELTQNTEGKKVAIAHETAFSNEAFPVQGSWRYLVDIDGSHYALSEVLKNGKKAKRAFNGGMIGFYAAAAEVPQSDPTKSIIRSLSWPNSDNNPVPGELQVKEVFLSQAAGDTEFKKQSESSSRVVCRNLKDTEGTEFTSPMISIDGLEFSAIPQNPKDRVVSTRIYKLLGNGRDCEKVDDLRIVTGKALFGFPLNGGKAPLIMMSSLSVYDEESATYRPANGLHLFDRDFKKFFFIGDRHKFVAPDAFPGMAADGRIIYAAAWKDCTKDPATGAQKCESNAGYVVTDPYQSEDIMAFRKANPELTKNMKKCITR